MIQWAAYDPATGVCIAELPGLRVTSSLSQIIGRGDPATVELPITDRLPTNWATATTPNRTVIAAVIDQGGMSPQDSPVLWAGFVDRRAYGSGPHIDLRLAPPEDWLDRAYIGTQTFEQVPDTTIMRGLGLDAVAAAFHGDVTVEAVGQVRDRTSYTSDQDKTRLTAMQELMAVIDGPEFVLGWRIDSQGRLCLTARTAPMLGRRTPTVLLSPVEWELVEDYSDGKGATIFTGVATREGDDRVTVTRYASALLAAGYLAVERRWSPDTGATSATVIAEYVEEARASQSEGTRIYTVAGRIEDVMPGRDLQPGDDIAVDLSNPDLPGTGGQMTMRTLGWVADPDPVSGEIVQIKPVLAGGGE